MSFRFRFVAEPAVAGLNSTPKLIQLWRSAGQPLLQYRSYAVAEPALACYLGYGIPELSKILPDFRRPITNVLAGVAMRYVCETD
jgi:hypothetical protein